MSENNEELKEKKKKKINSKKDGNEKKSLKKLENEQNENEINYQDLLQSNEKESLDENENLSSNDGSHKIVDQQRKKSMMNSATNDNYVINGDDVTDSKYQIKERSSVDIINDILNPTPNLNFDKSPYYVPVAVKAGDINALQDLDERKIIELKEAFFLFDLNGDGYIDAKDLRATFMTLGQENVSDQLIEQMLSEAPSPLDFDGFVLLLGYKTIELDPEEVLIEALSKWDTDKSGYISEEKIRYDLMSYGDRFTEKEATYALEEAPIANKERTSADDPILIDYQGFCKILGGLRKRKRNLRKSK